MMKDPQTHSLTPDEIDTLILARSVLAAGDAVVSLLAPALGYDPDSCQLTPYQLWRQAMRRLGLDPEHGEPIKENQ